MKKVFAILIALSLALVMGTSALAIDFTPVQDNAGALSQTTIDMIYNANEQVYNAGGGQIFVATDRYLPDGWQYADEYATQLFNDAAVGGANKNNGILLYFTTQDNKVWIVPGAGIKNFNGENLLEKYFYNDYDNYDYDRAVQKLIPQLVKQYGITYNSNYSGNAPVNQNPNTNYNPAQYANTRAGVAWAFVIVILLIIFIAVAFSRRSSYYRSPYYVVGSRPSWFWFMPGFYSGSRYRRYRYDYYRRNPPPRPPMGGGWGGGWGGNPGGSGRPNNGSGFFNGGGGGRSGTGGGGRSGSSGFGGGFGSGGGGRSGGSSGGGRSSGGGFSGGGGGRSGGGGGGRR